MPCLPLRVTSDLHLRDSASRIKTISQLAPLWEGISELVVNGDACDLRHGSHDDIVPKLNAQAAARGVGLSLIAGNHDPLISDVHERIVAAGQVWLTHGHIFFDRVVPWSPCAAELQSAALAEAAKYPPGALERLDDRYRIYRYACSIMGGEYHAGARSVPARLRRFLRTIFPPDRFFEMVQAWRDGARRADAFAERYHPEVRFVIFGHIHWPGIWHLPSGRIVINTGSFSLPRGPQVVDLHADRLEVRRVVATSAGFAPRAPHATFPLAPGKG